MSELSPVIMPFSLDGHSLRVVMREDKPWFVAADVCKALNVKDTSMACARLDEDERGVSLIGTRSASGVIQDREMVIISESGLYALVLRSRKPEANRFRKWVTSEVLPSIRKTGAYGTPREVSAPANYIAALEDLLASKKAEALALCDRDYSMHP
jgi:prophage antirepressor-like protein